MGDMVERTRRDAEDPKRARVRALQIAGRARELTEHERLEIDLWRSKCLDAKQRRVKS